MAQGTLILESLNLGTAIKEFRFSVTEIERKKVKLSPEEIEDGVPDIWSAIEFEIDDDQVPALAETLSKVLDARGWWVNFQTKTESFIVFSGRLFRYRRGDVTGRREAQAYARALRVPERQLDWPV
jgi:hypothetical protein